MLQLQTNVCTLFQTGVEGSDATGKLFLQTPEKCLIQDIHISRTLHDMTALEEMLHIFRLSL